MATTWQLPACNPVKRNGPQHLGDVLTELLAQYETKFPNLHVSTADTATTQGGSPMLVLARKPGERIVINEEITVTVLEVRGSQIRLGIEAPTEIPVRREEVRRPTVAAA